MPAEIKVVDASAVSAILFGESQAEALAVRLQNSRLVAPSILGYEVASVCQKKIRLYPSLRKALLRAHGHLGRLGLREAAVPHDEILKLALRTRLTVYDAAYLWLARALNAELITLDAKLEESARKISRSTKGPE